MEWLWRVLFFLGGIGFLLFWIAIFKVGSDSDLRIEIAKLKRDLALKETKMGAVNEAVDSFKRLGVPDTNEETHD